MGVSLNMIRFKDKIVITVPHEVPFCVVVAIWLLEVCITQAVDDFEEFIEKNASDNYRVLSNYENRDLVPTETNSPDSIGYRVCSVKTKFAIFVQGVVN